MGSHHTRSFRILRYQSLTFHPPNVSVILRHYSSGSKGGRGGAGLCQHSTGRWLDTLHIVVMEGIVAEPPQ